MQISLSRIFTRRGLYDAAPNFQEDFLIYSKQPLAGQVNCFGYALGVKEDFGAHHEQTEHIFDTHMTMTALPEILSHTGIEPIEDNNLVNIPDNHYPIAGFISCPGGDGSWYMDYHWYRMDNDGTWSHKGGWKDIFLPTRYDRSCQEIYNPLSANRSNPGNEHDKFIGFYAVPKGGAELFTSRQNNHGRIGPHIERSIKTKSYHGVIQLTV